MPMLLVYAFRAARPHLASGCVSWLVAYTQVAHQNGILVDVPITHLSLDMHPYWIPSRASWQEVPPPLHQSILADRASIS